jgi:hypothetical protein
LSLLRYIDGDYADPLTFAKLHEELGEAKQPLHYLAVPPSLFGTVAAALAKAGAARDARLVIEKPFGHDRASAEQLNRMLRKNFPERNIFRIDHFLGKDLGRLVGAFRTLGDHRIHGFVLAVIDQAFVAGLGQPDHHATAHPSQADHSKLHCTVPCWRKLR